MYYTKIARVKTECTNDCDYEKREDPTCVEGVDGKDEDESSDHSIYHTNDS
jgi:hypothetical protein